MKITIQSRSGRTLGEFQVNGDTTIDNFKRQFHSKNAKWYPDRQRFTIPSTTTPSADGKPAPPVALADEKKFKDYPSIKEGSVIQFKDLDPQISYRGVFLIEYGGPLLIYPLFYFFPMIFYGASQRPSTLAQDLALYCWTFHYLKRELETLFVHRFSHGTMPIFNLFRNSGYYWGCTAMVSYFVNHPLYTSPPHERVLLGLFVFLLAELGNFISHMQLRNLRPEGTTKRGIPRGFGFEYVSCPNYFFEVIAWIGFSVMTQAFTAVIFTLLGFNQMREWAFGKHRRYKKEFPEYPKNRKSIIPFLL